ncbi:MAG: FAD-binding oxidoreductase, partial [Geminicoccaceae bacterium]|nr:FAD-binding oxidoreductase [Geminicoccaceae bacterium]
MSTSAADRLPATPSSDVSERLARLLRSQTEGEVLFDAPSRGRYATDASIYQIMPVGVLVPKSERDIRAAIDIARDLKVPVLPRGGGSSLAGQTVGEAVVIDTSKYLRQILSIDPEAREVRVQPGITFG